MQPEKLEKLIIRTGIDYINPDNLSLKYLPKDYGKIISMEMQAIVCGNKFAEEKISYPKSAWQHLKKDYAPKWFTDRFPVEYTLFHFKAYDLYPIVSSKQPNLYVVKRGYNEIG